MALGVKFQFSSDHNHIDCLTTRTTEIFSYDAQQNVYISVHKANKNFLSLMKEGKRKEGITVLMKTVDAHV